MADDSSNDRLIQFTIAATLDLASIDNATASIWGPRQADVYSEFLQDVINHIANDPNIGRDAARFPGLKTYVAKSSRHRSANGHRIVYRATQDGVRIIRILHTAMQWEDHVEYE